MKKIFFGIIATISGLVLLFSYRTSLGDAVQAPVAQDAAAASGTSGTTGTGTGTSTGTGTGTPSSGGSSTRLTDGTYAGDSVSTRFGPVAVQITVAGGVITEVTVPQYPNSNGRDREINSRAIPVLISETTSAQSANIDMVSGATYTSDGYIQSLQSAIDQAFG